MSASKYTVMVYSTAASTASLGLGEPEQQPPPAAMTYNPQMQQQQQPPPPPAMTYNPQMQQNMSGVDAAMMMQTNPQMQHNPMMGMMMMQQQQQMMGGGGGPGQPPPQQQWMAAPGTIPGCPPGLEYLTQIDQILVHQVVELLEAFTGFETANRYVIKNSMGQQVYYAHEESDACVRQCCANARGFIMHITDNMNQEVMRVERQFKCCAGGNCCAACEACQMDVRVEAPPGTHIGTVRQDCSLLAPKYNVMDANDDTVLLIEGPVCMLCPQFCEVEFQVQSKDGQQMGYIKKQVAGLAQEMYTNADNFGITFPMDLSVAVKATLLGAVFLIDFMYFEQKQNNR